MDDRIGSLVPGKYADFTMLDRDPRTQPLERLRDLEILGTWVEGESVWNRIDIPATGAAPSLSGA
jgi:hypothetical protein